MLVLLNGLCSEYPLLADENWRGYWRNMRGLTQRRRGASSATSMHNQDINQYNRSPTTTALSNGAAGDDRPVNTAAKCAECDNTVGFRPAIDLVLSDAVAADRKRFRMAYRPTPSPSQFILRNIRPITAKSD